MVSAAPVLAAVSVLLAGAAWQHTMRWLAADRTLARTGHRAPSRPAPPALVGALRRADLDVDPWLAVHGWAGAAGAGVVVGWATGSGPLLPVLLALGPPAVVVARRHRAEYRRLEQLPLVLDAVAGSLRGGSSLSQAVGDASRLGGPVGSELALVAQRTTNGASVLDAVDAWAREHDDAPTTLAAAALAVAATVGGPGADAVDAAAASVRERAALDGELTALAVQARLSAAVLAGAPVVFAVLLSSLDPASARFLLGTPVGWACLTGGLALDALGALWMARIVRNAR